MKKNSYNLLINKLDEFIRKYYKNQLIKGGIYCVSILLLFYISINILEYFAYFGTFVRTIIFYSYLIINFLIIVKFIIYPLLKLYKIGKIISYEQAADIITKHFSNVKDILLNTLELKQISNSNTNNKDLIKASINQRIELLKPIPFNLAIDFSKNIKYLKYAIIPLSFIIIILLSAPGLIEEPTKRIIRHNVYFAKVSPFKFIVLNKKLEAIHQEDFQLDVKLIGNKIPKNVFIETENTKYKLSKENPILFYYNFKNVQKDIKFKLTANKVKSKEYLLKVLPKPIILNFNINLNYPKYIKKNNQILHNTGDLIIPLGTNVKWKFYTKNTKNIILKFNNKSIILEKEKSNIFSFSKSFLKSQNYSVSTLNEFLKNKDSLIYSINVIPDMYPTIRIKKYKDSIYDKRIYFTGLIKDDYGFNKLTFNYKYLKNNKSQNLKNKIQFVNIPINKSLNQQEFYYYFNLSKLSINPGEQIEYYFEVWDNDAINGSKSTKSQKMIYRAYTIKEAEQNNEKSNKEIKNNMEQCIKDAKLLQKQIDELNKKFIDKKTISWQEKKQLQNLFDKQKQLQKNISNIQKQNEEKTFKEQQYKQTNQEILKKQEELQKLFDNIMNDKEKEMFDKLQKMLEQINKTKVQEMLKKMKINSQDIEKELDINLELFKQLEFEKKLNETIDKLDKLANKQEELSEKTKLSKKTESEEIKEKQSKLNGKFKDVRESLKDLKKKNKELEKPNKIKNTDNEENNIQNEMNKSLDFLNNNKNGKAYKSQRNASKLMGHLSQMLKNMQQEMQEQEMGEDMDALREILENLIRISFDQENLMNKLKSINRNDPKYVKIIQQQKNLKDDLSMVEDSLFALSKRQIMIKPFINQQISTINQNAEKTIESLNDRRIHSAQSQQQYIMTSVNNLALLLSETLEQMKKQSMMQGSGQKKSTCSKSGKGNSSIKSMRQLQQQLNKEIEKLKKGEKPYGGKAQGQESIDEQLARLAAQQQAIRQQMQKYSEELKNEGKWKNENIKKLIKDMKKTETDIVNKRITNQTIRRQKEILTRLLKSEKAEREQEMDNKRESREAKNLKLSKHNKLNEFKKIKSNEIELLKTIPPTLKPFYKNKVNDYFYNFAK